MSIAAGVEGCRATHVQSRDVEAMTFEGASNIRRDGLQGVHGRWKLSLESGVNRVVAINSQADVHPSKRGWIELHLQVDDAGS